MRDRQAQVMALQASDDLSLPVAHAFDQRTGKEATVQQHQHVRLNRAQQDRSQAGFSHPTRGGYRIEDGMGSALLKIQATQLRKRTLAGSIGDASKVVGIGRRLGHVLTGAIDSHHAPSPAEGTLSLGGSLWATTAAKQLAHRGHPQLLASLTNGSIAGNRLTGIGPQEAGSTGQTAQDPTDRQARKEGQGDHQVQDGHHVEGFLALLPGMAIVEHLRDLFQRIEVLQHLEIHVMTQLVIFCKVTYAKGHQEAPFIWHQMVLVTIVCHIWTSSSYLNGIVPLRVPWNSFGL